MPIVDSGWYEKVKRQHRVLVVQIVNRKRLVVVFNQIERVETFMFFDGALRKLFRRAVFRFALWAFDSFAGQLRRNQDPLAAIASNFRVCRQC